MLLLAWEGFRWKTEAITSISIPSDSTHLLVYQSWAHKGLISSPAQNAGRVIALSVKTQPVATWLVYTWDCSNNVVQWQAATAIFSPLFIHLLSHLAFLVILALTPNQIYHAVRTVSVFSLLSVVLLLFHLDLSIFLGSVFFFSFFLVVRSFFVFVFVFFNKQLLICCKYQPLTSGAYFVSLSLLPKLNGSF